ncbi:MAG: hypothetical protein MUE60_15215 [Candidatus Eisenbacteria bacterium]|jgi:hypothetical protein|nr:hypothetical protein [Candidatus Eisenbacteria bacterium]
MPINRSLSVGDHPLFVHRLNTLNGLVIAAGTARPIDVSGRSALELDGLVLIPDLELEDAGIEVEVFAPAPCYPGVAFRVADLRTFELAYAVPAVSGQSDAIQYDPVFNGSNTWQLHSGPAYQQQATVPTGEWFALRVEVGGERACIQIGDQPPLVVEHLSHQNAAGRIGLWTYRPARFRNLRVTAPRRFDATSGERPHAPEGTIGEWWLDGVGAVSVEPNGVLNLNRWVRSPITEARLTRWFRVDEETDLEIALGFSDELALSVDDSAVFQGIHTFSGFQNEDSRGWVRPENCRVIHHVRPGRHRIEAILRVTEPFGWGMIMALGGDPVALLPPVDPS